MQQMVPDKLRQQACGWRRKAGHTWWLGMALTSETQPGNRFWKVASTSSVCVIMLDDELSARSRGACTGAAGERTEQVSGFQGRINAITAIAAAAAPSTSSCWTRSRLQRRLQQQHCSWPGTASLAINCTTRQQQQQQQQQQNDCSSRSSHSYRQAAMGHSRTAHLGSIRSIWPVAVELCAVLTCQHQ